MENAGKQFDPFIADVFFEVKDQFEAVSRKNADKSLSKV
jgi:response regulator RpfG family c-di-GMP phosphodiesterase